MKPSKTNFRYFLSILFVSCIVYASGCGESKPIRSSNPNGGTTSDTSTHDKKTGPSIQSPDTTKGRTDTTKLR